MGGDHPVARPGSGGPGCAPTGASLLDVGAICGQTVCAIAQSAKIGNLGNQVVRFDAYGASR